MFLFYFHDSRYSLYLSVPWDSEQWFCCRLLAHSLSQLLPCQMSDYRVCIQKKAFYEDLRNTMSLLQHNIQWTSVVSVEKQQQVQNAQSTIVASSVCVSLIIVIAIAAVYVGITCRNRHQMRSKSICSVFIAFKVKGSLPSNYV